MLVPDCVYPSDKEPEVIDFSDSDDGGTTASAGKRKIVAAGSTTGRKKART